VMVGRGAQGRPWVLAAISADLFGHSAPAIPQGAALGDMVVGHYHDMLGFYGTHLGVKVARKHLGWYLETAGLGAARAEIMAETAPARVTSLLHAAFADAERIAA
jgi:tRNA-dihydrouridine synthase B